MTQEKVKGNGNMRTVLKEWWDVACQERIQGFWNFDVWKSHASDRRDSIAQQVLSEQNLRFLWRITKW